ncbi:MAG: lipoprotein insertase outer membrane protein LolB [Gammaproteobacteria bacterium]
MFAIRPWPTRALFSLACLLSSCASLEEGPGIVLNDATRARLAAQEVWHMDGRVGVVRPDESWHAGLTWDHDRNVDRLYISGPFGQGALNIKVSERYIRVVSAEGSVEESEDPEALLRSIIGFPVPVPALRYWLLGLSYPAAQSDAEYDRSGRLKSLHQLGWAARYQDYQTVRQWSLPKKFSVVNDSTKIKLVIDEWRFPDNGL